VPRNWEPDLIMDVGMHRGEDAEFYLKKGFRVVGVEANPKLVADARQRLQPYLGRGQLEIYNVAIAPHRGQVDFFASEQSLWGSTSPQAAETHRQLAVATRQITVPCLPFADILERHGAPYYLKVDIEGSDTLCLRALAECHQKPRFVSIECDLTDRRTMFSTLATLWSLGYREFKLLNQALNPNLRCPRPPREGQYVEVRFTKSMSGPFGNETPGPWNSADEVWDRYSAIEKQHRLRTAYASTGRILGISVGRFHNQICWLYNSPLISAARRAYARLRGAELGGWFDLHARYSES